MDADSERTVMRDPRYDILFEPVQIGLTTIAAAVWSGAGCQTPRPLETTMTG